MHKERYSPKANKDAQITGDKFRFTVLSERLLRLEYNEKGIFEDRRTTTVTNRLFDVPKFFVATNSGSLKIETDYLRLIYHGGKFTKNSLSVDFCGKLGKNAFIWHFGESPNTLPGTNRTLDFIDGEAEIDGGLMSRETLTILDDSLSPVICDDGNIIPREKDIYDIYVFAYPAEYKKLLCDFYALTQYPPLLPRFALGNWWSRYHKYSDSEYISLMEKFMRHDIPISVAVIDMDWHKVDIDPKFGSGWTGFSWNRELFKMPKEFISHLHSMGAKVTLNLHPAEGISAHEDCYEALAKKLGESPKEKENIAFDITDTDFIKLYFDEVIRPLEEDGIDFFWIDWQQGIVTKKEGLDPLWMLNHFHFKASEKESKRGLILSRYAGFGSHRYPVGFSGDTFITWETLDFQPYFTICASNSGYGWWSHDIGGHLSGYRDDELMNRWVQFGVFSPIMRLHYAKNEFISHEPWDFCEETVKSMKRFMRLRHELIPYIYAMNYRSHSKGVPLMTPLYYEHPDDEDAYSIKNEYYFGTELLVCPITKKKDEKTNMGSTVLYLPDGTWFDFFNKYRYEGNRMLKVFRKSDEMPVFAKAGAIIPMCASDENVDCLPEKIIINIFPGADNSFVLYEDDGATQSYKTGKYLKTKIVLDWENKMLTLFSPEGDLSLLPQNRNYEIRINCVNQCNVSANCRFEERYKDGVLILVTNDLNACFEFSEKMMITKNDYIKKTRDILFHTHFHYDIKLNIYEIIKSKEKRVAISDIYAMDIDENIKSAILEVLI